MHESIDNQSINQSINHTNPQAGKITQGGDNGDTEEKSALIGSRVYGSSRTTSKQSKFFASNESLTANLNQASFCGIHSNLPPIHQLWSLILK
jgi:hypothetical protein